MIEFHAAAPRERVSEPAPAPTLEGAAERLPAWLGGARRLVTRLLVSLAIAASFVWVLRAGALPLVPGREAFSELRWWTVAAYVVGWSGVHVLRAARWRLLLAPIADVPLRRVFTASFIGFLAIVVLPLRTGEVVRPMLIRERGRLSAWAAAGTLGAERIVDGLVLSVVLFAALRLATPLDPLPERLGELPISVALVPRAAYAALVVFSLAMLAMLGFHVWKHAARRLTRWVVGAVSVRLSEWAAARVENVAEGLGFLSSWRQALPFVLATAAYWLLNAACTWLLAWGVGFDAFSYAEACVVTGVLALGILMPNAPGFFGAFQFSLYAALAVFYPRDEVLLRGAAFVLLVYLAQTAITVFFAAWAAFFGRDKPAPALSACEQG